MSPEPMTGGAYPTRSGACPLAGYGGANDDSGKRSGGLTVDPGVARRIACRNHRGQRTRFGDTVIGHIGRVAAGVPPEARAVAWLHDVLELTQVSRTQLRASGLTAVESVALELLTRGAEEPYDVYVLRIASAPGKAGWLARMVKRADLDDHLAHSRIPPDAPPYAWAHRCVLERIDFEPSTAIAS